MYDVGIALPGLLGWKSEKTPTSRSSSHHGLQPNSSHKWHAMESHQHNVHAWSPQLHLRLVCGMHALRACVWDAGLLACRVVRLHIRVCVCVCVWAIMMGCTRGISRMCRCEFGYVVPSQEGYIWSFSICAVTCGGSCLCLLLPLLRCLRADRAKSQPTSLKRNICTCSTGSTACAPWICSTLA